jgi:hypothetical protein
VGVVSYVSGLPIVDLYGLNNRRIARMPIAARGRPGHEKLGSAGHLLHERADISEMPAFPEPWASYGAVTIGGLRYYLVRHDQRLVAGLKPLVEVPDVGRHIDDLAERIGADGPYAMACDLAHAAEYYFARTYDPGRRDRLTARAAQMDSTLRGLEPVLLETTPPSAAGYQLVRRFSFDGGDDRWSATGDAFSRGPVAATPLGQQEVFGAAGPFLDSFTTKEQDAAVGTYRSAPFTIEGDVMTMQVGGGLDPARLRVVLVIDGAAVRSATGCNTEILTQRAWHLSDFRGRKAHLEIVDDSPDPWGHIVVDEIAEWRRP